MRTEEKVIPQPPQVRPHGPSHDGFAANDSIMTPDKVASIKEREYPKMMYCDGEEPLLVKTPEVEQTLGSGWRETLEDPNTPAAPLVVPTTREAYYKLNQADVLLIIAQVTDPVVLQRMRTSEVANPRRPNGRPAVLDAIAAALTPLEPVDPHGDAASATPEGSTAAAPVPPVATAPAVERVDENELDPLPARAAEPRRRKSTRKKVR